MSFSTLAGAPAAGGWDLSELPLEKVAGVPGVVLETDQVPDDVRGCAVLVPRASVRDVERAGVC